MTKPVINKAKLAAAISKKDNPEPQFIKPNYPKFRDEVIFKIINMWQLNQNFAGRIIVVHGEVGVGLTATVNCAIDVIKSSLKPGQKFINISNPTEDLAIAIQTIQAKLEQSRNSRSDKIQKDVIFIENFDNSLRTEVNSNKSSSALFDNILEAKDVSNIILTIRSSSMPLIRLHPAYDYMDFIEVPPHSKEEIIEIAKHYIPYFDLANNPEAIAAGLTDEKLLAFFEKIIRNNIIPDYYNIKKVMRILVSCYIGFINSWDEIDKISSYNFKQYKDNMIKASSLLSKLSVKEIKDILEFDYSPEKVMQYINENIILSEKNKKAVASIITRRRLNISLPGKPVASAILTGPTGVGKTETAKVIAKLAYGDEKRIVIVDMSKYKQSHHINDFIGSSPGYVGYNEETLFQKQHRQLSPCVVLFDEVEKAHPAILDLLIPLLDEGRLPLANGTVMNFSNDIILMTTNISVGLFEKRSKGFGFQLEKERNTTPTLAEVRQDMIDNGFRPELISRIDNILVYESLSEESIRKIIDLLFEKSIKQCFRNVKIEFVDVDKIKEKIFNSVNRKEGGRAIRKYIMNVVVSSIIDKLATGSNVFSVEDIDDSYNMEI
jgi:SpoVK/Ycf46/Vps4 family AAA+-type ATPase